MDKNKKPKYKLCERNLKVLDDLDFVRNVLKDLDVESEPATQESSLTWPIVRILNLTHTPLYITFFSFGQGSTG